MTWDGIGQEIPLGLSPHVIPVQTSPALYSRENKQLQSKYCKYAPTAMFSCFDCVMDVFKIKVEIKIDKNVCD